MRQRRYRGFDKTVTREQPSNYCIRCRSWVESREMTLDGELRFKVWVCPACKGESNDQRTNAQPSATAVNRIEHRPTCTKAGDDGKCHHRGRHKV